jgi:hypothetical protein
MTRVVLHRYITIAVPQSGVLGSVQSLICMYGVHVYGLECCRRGAHGLCVNSFITRTAEYTHMLTNA